MTFLRRLFAGCWRSHGQFLRERDAKGEAILVCEDCGAIRPMFTTAAIVGPKQQRGVVKGQPQMTAVRSGSVTRLTRKKAG